MDKETKNLFKNATNPNQYNSLNLNWEKEGDFNSPTRQFFYEHLKKNLENLTSKSILDIGSGTGYLTKLYLKLGSKEIYGIEPSQKNIKISKKFYPEMKVFRSSFEKLKLKKQFDILISVMVLEHIKNLDFFFKKASNLAKPYGMFYLVVGDKKYLTTKRFNYKIKIKKLESGEAVISTKKSYGIMYDIVRPISKFIETAKKTGFAIERSIPLDTTKNIIKSRPEYKKFENKPLSRLLIFKKE